MKVSLIDYTGYGCADPARRAAELLIFTKSTRLEMSPNLIKNIKSKTDKEIKDELEYMSNTIPSSWEFVDFTFLIQDVTRAFTHQLVRTRQASYAQQTMRMLDKADFNYATGPSIKGAVTQLEYDRCMSSINEAYQNIIHNGAKIEDARGILPTNILTNIVMKINMRNFIDLIKKRSGKRTQVEYRDVLDAMKIEVERVFDWFYIFAKKNAVDNSVKLENLIAENPNISNDDKLTMFKLIDTVRKEL